tara:strand:+ start:180 stop:485 length:306 start_codon:yes stop_codon:yes gene_type:complete
MKSLKILFFIILVSPALNACQTVTTKIDKTTEQEKKELSQWLNKSEADLKIFFGQPDKVEFLKTRNRNYIYITEKYKIKCERKFEINPKNMVVGFSSKNCF